MSIESQRNKMNLKHKLELYLLKKCTEVQDMGGWQGVCLPAAPKEDCPEGSHGQLANLNGQIPNCK